jgi:hypothetical protein
MPSVYREGRGFFGWVFLIVFLAFNLLMLAWMVGYWQFIGSMDFGKPGDPGQTGATIGAALATGFILFVWVCGAVITGLLALLTRGRSVVDVGDRGVWQGPEARPMGPVDYLLVFLLVVGIAGASVYAISPQFLQNIGAVADKTPVENPALQPPPRPAVQPAVERFECKLENWKYSAAGGGTSFTYIEGKTSCARGTIIINVYDGGEKYLGNVRGHIEGYAFKAVMQVTAPKAMQLKYSFAYP